MQTLAVYVPTRCAERIKAQARSQGVTISSVLAKALIRGMPGLPWGDTKERGDTEVPPGG